VKNKPIRYFFGFISIPFLILTISTIRKHSADIKKETSKFCGTFKIDIGKSKYDKVDLTKRQNLILKVTTNNKFCFIGDTISFIKQTGTWKYTDNEDGGYLECFFDLKRINAYRSYDNRVWTFQSDCLKNSLTSDIVYFNRIE
jgi:hypothetical protein